MKPKKVTVVQDDEKPVTAEILAKSIVDISAAAHKMMNAGLKEEVLVLLIHDHTKVGKPDIRSVLRCLPELRALYTKK